MSGHPEPLVTKDIRFAIVPEWVLYHPDLSPQAVRLYLTLERHADRDTRTAYPSRARLAGLLDVSVKTVDRALHELITVGAVSAKKRFDDAGDPTSNMYVVHAVPPEGVAPRMTPPRDTDDQGGRDTDDATGSPKDDALTRTNLNQKTPLPPASGGDTFVCAKPGPTPHANCRGCGTTNRQLERQRRLDDAQRRRDQAEAERAARDLQRVATEERPPELAQALRAGVARGRAEFAKGGRL